MLDARHRSTLAISALLALAAACGGDDDGNGAGGGDGGAGQNDADPNAPDAATFDCEPRSGTDLGLELVASGFEMPLFVTSPPGDKRLFVVEKGGVIKIIEDGQVLPTPFLDIEDRLAWSGPGNINGERGLLGLAFHPDYAQTGRFFVFYTAAESEVAGPGANVLAQYLVSDDPNVADPSSELRLIEVDDFAGNHNGGMMAFGPDGYLYVGFGDGGNGDDPYDNGQNKATLLGDMIRIDVDSDNPYAIPDGNPYKGKGGPEREEIWLSGVRNPWRWSFDRATGDMYIADVGQDRIEEVTVIPAGQGAGKNLGWDEVEGNECFDDPASGTDPNTGPDCDLGAYTAPVHTYGRNQGDSITGGYVYRGTCFPDIVGWYFFGDWGSTRLWKFVYADGQATELAEITDDIDPEGVIDGLASFGEDAFGELYVVSLRSGDIHRIVVQ